MKAPITNKQLLEMMWERFPEIMGRGVEQPAQQEPESECNPQDLCAGCRCKYAEQPAQQEPVATLWQHGRTGRTRITMPGDITDCDADWFKASDLYTSPPAQRTWVGLTIEDKKEYIAQDFGGSRTDAMDWTEKRLMEKNT